MNQTTETVETKQVDLAPTKPFKKRTVSSPKRLFIGIGVVVLILILLLGTLATGAWMIYIKHSDAGFIRALANRFPIPAARVGSRTIYYRDYLHTHDTLKTFLASPAAKAQNLQVPLDESLEKNILEKLVNEAALEELADQKHVTVTDEQLREYFSQVISSVSSTTPDVGVYLLQNFGWNEEDFRQQVLKESLLEQQLGEEMAKENNGDTQALANYMDKRLQQKDIVRYLRFK